MTGLRHLYYAVIRWFSDTTQIPRFTGYGLYDREFVRVLERDRATSSRSSRRSSPSTG